MKLANAIVKYRIPILILAIVLLIPATIGYVHTRVNYDMLDYLPTEMDTVIGQNELLEDFGYDSMNSVMGACAASSKPTIKPARNGMAISRTPTASS